MSTTIPDEFRRHGRFTARLSAMTTEEQVRDVERLARQQQTTTSAVVRAAIHEFVYGPELEEDE